MRAALSELAGLFGVPLAEEAEGPPPEPVFSKVDDGSPEQQFAAAVSLNLRPLRGRAFNAPNGTLSIAKTKRPIVQRRKDGTDFIVPIVVAYDGKGSGEEWASVEREVEAAILALMQATEVNGKLPENLRLVRRAKVDPFVDDPSSLTLLRFRSTRKESP